MKVGGGKDGKKEKRKEGVRARVGNNYDTGNIHIIKTSLELTKYK